MLRPISISIIHETEVFIDSGRILSDELTLVSAVALFGFSAASLSTQARNKSLHDFPDNGFASEDPTCSAPFSRKN